MPMTNDVIQWSAACGGGGSRLQSIEGHAGTSYSVGNHGSAIGSPRRRDEKEGSW